MRSNPDNSKKILLSKINSTFKMIYDVQFFNKDFRKFLSGLSIDQEKRILSHHTLIYCDSPYIESVYTYSDSDIWTQTDSNDLFNCLEETGCKYAMSEFDHPFILDQAKQRGLNVHIIGERQNLKNRRTEILVTNYRNQQGELFDAIPRLQRRCIADNGT